MRHCVLDGAGETHGVGCLGLQRLALLAQGRRLKGAKAVTTGDDPIDQRGLFGVIDIVGLRHPHQKGGQGNARIRVGKRGGVGLGQPLEEVSKHGKDIATG